MGRTETEGSRCKKHHKHRQSAGVCPFCLRERLSRLAAAASSSSSVAFLYSSEASSSPCSSDSDLSTAASSPPRQQDLKRSRVSLMSLLLKGEPVKVNAAGLTKSRSLVYVIGRPKEKEKEKKKKKKKKKCEEEGKEKAKESKKKGRFWQKLLGGSIRRTEREEGSGAFVHSKTFKEKHSAKWVNISS